MKLYIIKVVEFLALQFRWYFQQLVKCKVPKFNTKPYYVYFQKHESHFPFAD